MTWVHSLKLWEIASEMFVFSHTIHFFLEDVLEDHEGRISICRWHRWHGKKWGWNLGPCWTSSDVEQQLKYIFRHQSQWDICRNSNKFQVHWIHHLYLRNMNTQCRFTMKMRWYRKTLGIHYTDHVKVQRAIGSHDNLFTVIKKQKTS